MDEQMDEQMDEEFGTGDPQEDELNRLQEIRRKMIAERTFRFGPWVCPEGIAPEDYCRQVLEANGWQDPGALIEVEEETEFGLTFRVQLPTDTTEIDQQIAEARAAFEGSVPVFSFEFSLRDAEDARQFRRHWGPRAKRLIGEFLQDNSPEGRIGKLFGWLGGSTRWLALPEDDPSREAYEDGLKDRLKLGGLGSYWLDESGQTNLDRYTQSAQQRARAPGSAETIEEAQQLIAEEMERARQEGVRFGSSDDVCRFAAELAGAVFAGYRERPKPRKQRRARPQEAKKRVRKFKAYASPAAAAADRTGTLDKFLEETTESSGESETESSSL